MVSVIIPNYNHAPFLRERIDSVLAQDYSDFEVILLDDCSTDGSRDIINSYKDHPKVSHVVFNEQNSGSTFIQWERGMQLAQGKFIWIAESDDVAMPTFLSSLVPRLEVDALASVAYCHSFLIDAQGRRLSAQNDRNPAPKRKMTHHFGNTFIKYLLDFNYIYNASMAVFRRKAIADINRDYMKYRYCGDWHFWASLCRRGNVLEVHDMLNGFRQHPSKVTELSKEDTVARWTDELEVLSYIHRLCHLNSLENHCFQGRVSKRLHAAHMDADIERELRQRFAPICGGSLDVMCYEVGKTLFGFLRHRQHLGFLSSFKP